MVMERLDAAGKHSEKNDPKRQSAIEQAREALKPKFGEICIPEPPVNLFQTMENLAKLGITEIDTRYFPERRLKEDDMFWEDMVKPRALFWQMIKKGRLLSDAATLREGWYIILDPTGKPNYDNGKQRYKNDYLESIMQDLRQEDKIKKYSLVSDTSRFGASPEEIERVILPEFACTIDTEGEVINKRYIEFNVWGNMFYPRWGQTDTWEWFTDKFGAAGLLRLIGGGSGGGGLAVVDCRWSDRRGGRNAFSPMVRFPSKPR
ncbi:MAG: hypothetical protein Q8P80_00220 [Candidatus Levybacteria bacterium]|nr:hypothetical protein [Candidatus Levybacteria bacterium]